MNNDGKKELGRKDVYSIVKAAIANVASSPLADHIAEDIYLELEGHYILPADYCAIGMDECNLCRWKGDYPVSGCPNCHRSFVE